MTVLERFHDKVAHDPMGGCWLWTGSTGERGYGFFKDEHKLRLAHRFAYEAFVGPLDPDLTIDHICNIPSCVNPTHLRQMTIRENVLRGDGPPARNARKQACPRGHAYHYSESKRQRMCRVCENDNQRRRRAAKARAQNV